MKAITVNIALFLLPLASAAGQEKAGRYEGPIIDMHLHAKTGKFHQDG